MADPSSPAEISEGNWDFSEFLKQCKDYTNPERHWSISNVVGGWIALAKYHVTSPDGEGLAEAVRCLEKAQSVDSTDKRSLGLNVWLQAKHLTDAHEKTMSLKDYVKARHFLYRLKKRKPALAEAVNVQVQHLVEKHGGFPNRFYKWGDKIKECKTRIVNCLRHDSWPFIKKRLVNMIDNVLGHIATFIAGLLVYHFFLK